MPPFFEKFRRPKHPDHRKVSKSYQALRDQLFAIDPADLGLTLEDRANPVWAVLMETAYPEAVSSLLATAEGTVSLYFSNGGGIIGLGQHPEPARIAAELLDLAPQYLTDCKPTADYSLPPLDTTRIYLLTFDKTFAAEVPEETLALRSHPIAPLYQKAQDLITTIRKVNEQHEKNQ